MPIQKSFRQQRIDDLVDWATNEASIPGIDQATYIQIVDYVLREQHRDGFWMMEGFKWKVVMTAVVLKALAHLRFKTADCWLVKDQTVSGIKPAVDFLIQEVTNTDGQPERVGEDIWDACQVALALAEFGGHRLAKQMARQINEDWRDLYRNACNATKPNRWCGPAFLAAMVDVMGRYEQDLGDQSHFADALAHLKNLEQTGIQGKTLGFPATTSRQEIDLWTTSLVLRTLTSVPKQHERLIDRGQVQRIAEWLLAQLKARAGGGESGEEPMFVARCLHGLRASGHWVDSQMQEQISNTVEGENRHLAEFFRRKPDRHGSLKAYTVVLEYLASWTTPVPLGLVFHAASGLGSSFVAQTEPQLRSGGLRIAWLSDLHVAAEDRTVPGSFNLLKQFAGKFMRLKGTPLTQHFQLRNVQTILDRVKQLKADHIIVSGDLTNYAQESQFRAVHDQFLAIQAAITRNSTVSATSGELDRELWTILPGNHDVTDEKSTNDTVRPNLGMFFQWFSKTYQDPRLTLDMAFPLVKILQAKESAISVRLIGLDSTAAAPVWRVGVNARGRMDPGQILRLTECLSKKGSASITLVVLHHHPMVVPEFNWPMEDYFLSLKESDGRALIKLCANTGVNAILHGHFHVFSSWSALTPLGRPMMIIGSPAGTLNIPNTCEEFLELREAHRETPLGVQQGLAVCTQRHTGGGNWTEGFTGIFLPSS